MDVHVEPKPRTPGPSEISLEEGNTLLAPLLPPKKPMNRVRTDEADFEQSTARVNVTLPRMTLQGEPGDQAQHTLTPLDSTVAQDTQSQNSRESDSDSDVGEDETGAVSQDSVLEEHIIDAIESGDVPAVQHWLDEEGADVNKCRGGRASNGHFFVGDGTALHWAAYYGKLEIVNLLVDRGANPYEKARGGETVLHWACQCKEENETVVMKLLTFRVRTPDYPVQLAKLPDSKGWTPLHYACYDNNMKLVLQLISAGTDANAKNDDNFTPLHLLNKNSGEELDLLDPDHLLPRANDPVLQENIIEKIKKGDLKRFLKWLNGKKGRVNCYRGGLATEGGLVVEGGTALHWAAYYGQRDIVDALIRGKAGFKVLNSKRETILHWACKGQKTNEDLVRFLLKEVDVNFADVDGYTALHYACWRGNHNIAELILLQKKPNKADRNAQALYGETPLGTAFRSGKKDLINLLDKDHLLPRDDDPELDASIVEAIKVDDKATVEEKMNEGINCKRGGEDKSNDFEVGGGTALHWAAYYGMVEIAKLLLGRKASPEVMDKNGETILHWACKSKRENVKMVKWLLKEHVTRKTLAGDEATKVQVDSTNSDGYTALHYACWKGYQKVAQLLKEAEADPRARSISGYTPLDFAVVGKKNNWGLARKLDDRHLLPRAEFPRLEKCIIEGGYTHHVQKWLKSQHRNVDHCRDRREGGTALHWAAYHGRLDIVKLLIENGANPKARAYDNGTVLHWACRSEEGNRDLVRLLRKKGCKLNDRDENGCTPFHLAASQGCQWVVEELLEWDRLKAINSRVLKPEAALKAKDNEGQTPLVKASLKGHHSVVKLLLKRGVIVEQQDLRAAIEEGNKHVVSDLLQSPQWPTLLRQSWEETTPFRELIKEMPDIAKQILDRCVVSNPETPDPKNKGYEVVLDYSFVEDHQNWDERSKAKTATKFPEVIRNSLTREPKEVALEMNENPQVGHASEPKLYPEKKEEWHKKRFDETNKFGPRFKKSNHPLDIMVQHDRLDMLTHPVISSLLQYKWFHFGLWLYLLNLLLYIIFLLFLTAFTLVVLLPQSSTCLQVFSRHEISVCENETESVNSSGEYTAGSGHNSEMMAGDTAMNVTCVKCELSGSTLRSVFAAMVILFALLHLFVKAFKLGHEPKKYIRNWMKLLVSFFEVSLYTLSIIFVFVFRTPCMCPQEWQWQIGVITVLLAWIYLIRVFAKIPSIGIYIIMFGHIVLTFLKVIVFSVLLLITFGFTFWMTFSEAQFQQSPFYTPTSSMVKVMSMTVGDFSFDETFRKSPSGEQEGTKEILFPVISYLLWIIFLVIMPILFINLLIGLAVGDTKEIQEKARLTRLALQVDMILAAENLLHVLHIHKYFSTVPSPERIKPNETKEFSFWNIIYYLIFQESLNYCLEDSEPKDQNEMSHQVEQIAEDVKEHVLEAKNKHTEALERMEERMQALEQLIKEVILTNQKLLSDRETQKL